MYRPPPCGSRAGRDKGPSSALRPDRRRNAAPGRESRPALPACGPRRAPERIEPFGPHDVALRAEQNALRPGQIDEHGHDLRQANGQGQGRHLDDEVFAVAIDDQSAQAVAFAEDQSRGALGLVVAQHAPQMQGRFQPPPPKGLVQRLGFVPGIQANVDPAAAIEDPAGDEASCIGAEIDDVAVGRTAFDAVDGRIEDPGMPAEKGPGFSRFEQDTCQADSPKNLASLTGGWGSVNRSSNYNALRGLRRAAGIACNACSDKELPRYPRQGRFRLSRPENPVDPK